MWLCAPDLHDLVDIRGLHHMSWSFTVCVQHKHHVLPVHEFLTVLLRVCTSLKQIYSMGDLKKHEI